MPQEIFCAPGVLWLEMVRDVSDDLNYRNSLERAWMDWAEVDAVPFLFYLQYLNYGSLGARQRQQTALQRLVDTEPVFHPETVLNIIGHCWEIEGLPQLAEIAYRRSLNILSRNNAANWHLRHLARSMQN